MRLFQLSFQIETSLLLYSLFLSLRYISGRRDGTHGKKELHPFSAVCSTEASGEEWQPESVDRACSVSRYDGMQSQPGQAMTDSGKRKRACDECCGSGRKQPVPLRLLLLMFNSQQVFIVWPGAEKQLWRSQARPLSRGALLPPECLRTAAFAARRGQILGWVRE